MSVIPPNNNTTLIIDDFINYATAHLSTVAGIINTISLYPPVAAPAPGVLPWTGYQVTPATPGGIASPNPYEQLDWSQVPLDKNSLEVQEIIAPNLEQIEIQLQNEPLVEYDNPDTYPIILEMDNVVAETLDNALYEQKILNTEPDTPEKKEEQKKLISSGYKTLDELLKIAGAWAPKLGKNSRVKYENLRSNYIKGVHGLCPQGTQAVVVALTGISKLGTISGNADWFSFKDPSTGGGRSSFATNINGKTYYNDKVNIDFDDFVADSTRLQIGDILVNGYQSKDYGHIQVWTGFKWVSDFSQNKIHTTGCLKSSAALWRLNNNGIAAVESVKSKSA